MQAEKCRQKSAGRKIQAEECRQKNAGRRVQAEKCRQKSVGKRVQAHRWKTENGSVRSWRVGFVNCQEFSHVDRSSRVEAVVAQRSEFVLYS